jgi:cell division septum initiation protein DivIVA
MTQEELKAIYKKGRDAYKKAMINFQDKFYEKLGRHYGLNRMGPRRLRRSRSEEVEQEAYVEKELAYAQKIMAEALRIKAEVDTLKAEARTIKTEVENMKLAAQNEAKQIINTGKLDSERLLENAKEKAEREIRDSEFTAQDIKRDAWKNAMDITKAATKEAAEIIDRAKGFVNMLLGKVSELPSGDNLVRWARTFIKSVQNEQPASTAQDKEKSISL